MTTRHKRALISLQRMADLGPQPVFHARPPVREMAPAEDLSEATIQSLLDDLAWLAPQKVDRLSCLLLSRHFYAWLNDKTVRLFEQARSRASAATESASTPRQP